jgi:hypothetical protein
VDGYNPFDTMVDLHSGREPRLARQAGRDRHAASFVLRDLSAGGCGAGPRVGAECPPGAHPDVHAMVYPKRGADLERELKWLGSYRYAVLNLGAPSVEQLHERFRGCAPRSPSTRTGMARWGSSRCSRRGPGDD